jgi:hypothetical protein
MMGAKENNGPLMDKEKGGCVRTAAMDTIVAREANSE